MPKRLFIADGGLTSSIPTPSGITLIGAIDGSLKKQIGYNIIDIGGTTVGPTVQTISSTSSISPISTNDIIVITSQSTSLFLENPQSGFSQGQALMIRIKDDGTPRAITYDTKYRAIGITLPTTTSSSKTIYLGIIYNLNDDRLDCIGLSQQA